MDKSFKDKILERVDIVAVVGERVDLTRKGKDYVGLCPFHDDHKPSMSVSPSKQIFKCWSCGAGGDVIRFVQLHQRVTFPEALAILARRAGVELHSGPQDTQAARTREGIQAAVNWACQHFQRNFASSEGQRAREYARSRGLTQETVDRFGLGFAPDRWDDLLQAARRAGLGDNVLHQAGLVVTNDSGRTYDRFRNRLIFPIRDRMGRPIAFGGRTLGDDPAKYLNSPETPLFSKSRVLYGLDLARRSIEKEGAAIIVEGYMDAVLLVQHGFGNVLATLGTALTEAHAELLRPLAKALYLCFDGDEAGIRAAERAVEVALRSQAEIRVVLLAEGEDPADCVLGRGPEGFAAALNAARDALEFKWSQTLRSFDRGDARGRRQAVEQYLQFVAGAALAGGVDPLGQDLLVGRLSDLLGVPKTEVFERLEREKRTRHRATPREPAAAGESGYEASLRGLPAGLITAVETVLGLLVRSAVAWRWVDDAVGQGVEHSETWTRLYRVLVDVHQDLGEYSLRDVVERCEDGAVCELVHRAAARAAGLDPSAEVCEAARARLAAEVGVLRMSELRRALQGGAAGEAADAVRAFRALHECARGKESVLAPAQRWSTPRRP